MSRTCRSWWTAGCRATGALSTCRRRTRQRSGPSSCSGGCCWSRGSARIRRPTSPGSWAPPTPRTAAPWLSATSAVRVSTEGILNVFTSIAGRAVVVTGATRGIGKGIARVFADNGARVLIVGRDKDAAAATVADLTAGGAEVSYLLADVSVREGCQLVAATAADRLGGVDVLCANAGIFPDKRLADMTDEDLDKIGR